MSDNIITIEEAYCAATEFFKSIQFKTTFAGGTQLTLEEFEFAEPLNCWFITLGFVPVRREETEEQYNTFKREYRIFKVNAVTKEVESMKKGFMGCQEDNTTRGFTITSQEPIPEVDLSEILSKLTRKA